FAIKRPYSIEMTTGSFHLSHRQILTLTGSDTLEFLNRILTCQLNGLKSGEGRYGALLTPQGKILTDVFILTDDNSVYLDLPASMIEDIQKRLTLLKLRAKIEIVASPDLGVFQSATNDVPNQVAVMQDERHPIPTYRIIAPAELADDNWPDALTSPEYQAARFSAAIPEYGLDYNASEVFPSDVNLDILDGVDYHKGCFIGQEVVSRMKRKTEVRKRTLRVADLPETAESGSAITAGQSTVGTLTSASGTAGLALIRLDRLSASALSGETPVIGEKPIIVLATRDTIDD
ncbi:MAG: hypothetical protein CMK07_13230, partial [Ponticaulis sp.]|nr:hypothetical protein [Ponticaulis sp.]